MKPTTLLLFIATITAFTSVNSQRPSDTAVHDLIESVSNNCNSLTGHLGSSDLSYYVNHFCLGLNNVNDRILQRSYPSLKQLILEVRHWCTLDDRDDQIDTVKGLCFKWVRALHQICRSNPRVCIRTLSMLLMFCYFYFICSINTLLHCCVNHGLVKSVRVSLNSFS